MDKADRLRQVIEQLVRRDQIPLVNVIACASAIGKCKILGHDQGITIVFTDGSQIAFDDDGEA